MSISSFVGKVGPGPVVTEATIARLCGAPSDWPLMARALQRLAEALAVARVPQFGRWASDVHDAVADLARRTSSEPFDLPLLLAGRRGRHKVWAYLVGTEAFSRVGLELLGCEFIMALALHRPVRASIVQRAVEIQPVADGSDHRYVARVGAQARMECRRIDNGVTPQNVSFNALLRTCLALELESLVHEKREGTTGRRTLPPPIVRSIGQWLHMQEDAESISSVIGFISGLTWDLATLVPFGSRHERGSDRLALIDVLQGVLHIDLREVLPGTAGRTGCEPASWCVMRPLPTRTAMLLRELCARNPMARCLRDLIDIGLSSHDRQAKWKGVTKAKFLSSRGAASLEAGLDRKVAALAVGALSLVSKPETHYLCVAQSEIEQGLQHLYRWLSWSEPVSVAEPLTSLVGTQVSPTRDTVQQLDQWHKQRVEALRVGRNSSIERLLDFHNAFAVFCVHRTAFFTLARASKTYAFDAAALCPSNAFGTLVDKRTGILRGATPIPLPVTLSHQIRLWLSHLRALDHRLQRLGRVHDKARQLIQKTLDGTSSPLFFRIHVDSSVDVPGSKDVFGDSGQKGDAYRHFVSNQLRLVGVPAELVEAACRHVSGYVSVHSIGSPLAPIQWLIETSRGLDSVAARLAMAPVPGLRRDVR